MTFEGKVPVTSEIMAVLFGIVGAVIIAVGK